MRSRRLIAFLALLSTALLLACAGGPTSKDNSIEMKRWLLTKRQEPVLRYVLDAKIYFLAPLLPCFDCFDDLFDEQGNYICSPTGGFAGQGDESCPRLRQLLRQSKGEVVPNPFYKP